MKSFNVVVVCTAVCVFFKDGCYLNYIATDHEKKFNTTFFGSVGDNYPFSKRGLATKVISIICLHALCMSKICLDLRMHKSFCSAMTN